MDNEPYFTPEEMGAIQMAMELEDNLLAFRVIAKQARMLAMLEERSQFTGMPFRFFFTFPAMHPLFGLLNDVLELNYDPRTHAVETKVHKGGINEPGQEDVENSEGFERDEGGDPEDPAGIGVG